jgi:hypothetical protein
MVELERCTWYVVAERRAAAEAVCVREMPVSSEAVRVLLMQVGVVEEIWGRWHLLPAQCKGAR